MSESNSQNQFVIPTVETSVALTPEWVKTLPMDNEGQRFAASALDSVARTLGGLGTFAAWELRQDFCNCYGKVSAEAKRAKARGAVFKFATEADFSKAGVFPPLLAPLTEAADLVFKLRKLAVLGKDDKPQVDLDAVRIHHAEKYAHLTK